MTKLYQAQAKSKLGIKVDFFVGARDFWKAQLKADSYLPTLQEQYTQAGIFELHALNEVGQLVR